MSGVAQTTADGVAQAAAKAREAAAAKAKEAAAKAVAVTPSPTSSTTIANADPTVGSPDPIAHVMAMVAKLNRAGYSCSIAKHVARYGGIATPIPWLMGPAGVRCMHGKGTVVEVSAYDNVKLREAADAYIKNTGQVLISSEDWNVTVSVASDAK